MKSQVLLIAGLALSMAGCADGGRTAPEREDQMQMTSPVADEGSGSETEGLSSNAFMEHMHAHADQLDKINYALADDDLYGAMTPAYWLSRHEDASGIPTEWQPYVTGMREAARAVENATDLTTARAAAKRLNQQCQGCHAVAGIR